MKIAFLGTGLMGAPMSRHLAAKHDVTVWNRSRRKAEPLADVATIADTPAEAVVGADVIIMMLMDGPAVREVLSAELLEQAKGATIVDMGSVDPATDIALAAEAATYEIGYVDAPVSGGTAGAEAASLAILVGGSDADVARVAPVLSIMGRPTHLGPVGAGQIAKLANQLIVATTIGAVAEAMRLAESGGCDPAAWRNALMGGFADSRILDLHGARMVNRDFAPGGRSDAQLKDLNNALNVARDAGLELPLSETITAAFRDFVEVHDGGMRDHAAYYEWLSLRQN